MVNHDHRHRQLCSVNEPVLEHRRDEGAGPCEGEELVMKSINKGAEDFSGWKKLMI